MSNPFSYCELHTADPNRAKEFYSKLFDWKLSPHDFPFGVYHTINAGSGPEGGMMKLMDAKRPSAWLVYVAVDDVQAATRKAQSLGASVQSEKTEVPGHGWFSVLTDPTGATFALWEALKKG